MEKAIVNFDDSALKLEYDATGPSAVVYDFEGNVISGGGGSDTPVDISITITNGSGCDILVQYPTRDADNNIVYNFAPLADNAGSTLSCKSTAVDATDQMPYMYLFYSIRDSEAYPYATGAGVNTNVVHSEAYGGGYFLIKKTADGSLLASLGVFLD